MHFCFDTTVGFDKKIHKILKKKPEIWRLITNAMMLLCQDPGPKTLRVHKLSGMLKEHWSFSLTYDLRVIYRREKDKIILVNIGSHDEVY